MLQKKKHRFNHFPLNQRLSYNDSKNSKTREKHHVEFIMFLKL